MDKKSRRQITWHILPVAYLIIFCAFAELFLPPWPRGMLTTVVRVTLVWAGVSGGILLHRLRRQRLAASSKQG